MWVISSIVIMRRFLLLSRTGFPYLDISCDYGHITFSIGPKITFLLKRYPRNIRDMYGFDMLNYVLWHRPYWTSNLHAPIPRFCTWPYNYPSCTVWVWSFCIVCKIKIYRMTQTLYWPSFSEFCLI